MARDGSRRLEQNLKSPHLRTKADTMLFLRVSFSHRGNWALVAESLAAVAILFASSLPTVAGELHKAARSGDLGAVTAAIEAGADVNEIDGEGRTALHAAANADHADIVAALLAAEANPLVSGKGPFGSTGTPLHLAAKRGNLDSIRVLLEAGVDPNLPDSGVGPPLHLAIYYHRQAAADYLISNGAGPVTAEPVNALIVTADPADGEVIAGTCRACHNLEADKQSESRPGPALWDLIHRPKASVAGFAYSEAMREAAGIWSYDDLNSFLANPRGYVPGTKMSALEGIKTPERRAALIRYLRGLSDAPAPLPE